MMQVWTDDTKLQVLNPSAMLDRMTYGFLALDDQWRIAYLNDAAYDSLFRDSGTPSADLHTPRQDREALLGCSVWAALPDSAERNLSQIFQAAMDSQAEARIDYRCGEAAGFELRLSPAPSGLTMLILPAQEHSGEGLQLARRLDNFMLAQQIAGIGYYEWNLADGSMKMSDEMFEILGYSGPEYPDDWEAFFGALHPDDADKIFAFIRELEALAQGQDSGIMTVEYRIIDPSARVKDIQATSKLIRDGEDSAVRIFGTMRDITAQKQTEEMLRKSEKLKTVGQLAAGIAHEIRNPLTSLKGFNKLLRHASESQAERYYQIMEAEFDRIEQILDELLVMAKPHATSYRPWDVRLVVQEVVELMGSQAILNNVIILCEIADQDGIVPCEKNQLKQVIMNIVKNAIEAMPGGGELKVRVWREPDAVSVSVTDQGAGIGEDMLQKLGEPFYTTKEKGTGLGLMVSYRIIEEHEGTLAFSSRPGAGTTATIRLPLKSRQH